MLLGLRAQFFRQVFVGEVDIDFEPGQQVDQIRPPCFVLLPQTPAQLGQGLPSLRLGFGIDQIGDRFGLSQVQLPMLKRPA